MTNTCAAVVFEIMTIFCVWRRADESEQIKTELFHQMCAAVPRSEKSPTENTVVGKDAAYRARGV